MRIGITLTSSLEVGQEFIDLTKTVARRLAKSNIGIVYGGTAYGMMSTLAETYKQTGGNDLTGVMAKDLMKVTKNYIAYSGLDHTYLEETMEDRKRRIVELADAFIILPGGYGTFEEIGTIIGGKANKLFDKPIAFYNFKGYYDTFFRFLSEMQNKQFSKITIDQLFLASTNLEEIIEYITNYQSAELADKFIK